MSENRCPRCEAVMHELDCLECVAYHRMRTVIPLVADRGATIDSTLDSLIIALIVVLATLIVRVSCAP